MGPVAFPVPLVAVHGVLLPYPGARVADVVAAQFGAPRCTLIPVAVVVRGALMAGPLLRRPFKAAEAHVVGPAGFG